MKEKSHWVMDFSCVLNQDNNSINTKCSPLVQSQD